MIPTIDVQFNPQRRSTLLTALGTACIPFEDVIAHDAASAEFSLHLYNLHTTESFQGVYWADGEYDTGALNHINHLLRDHRTNEVIQIDPRLLSILYITRLKVGNQKQPFSVISGYRSAETNRKLALVNAGVAANSFHIEGRAIDIRLPGIETAQLRDAGLSMRVGGVGYYERSDFVHLDTGPFRHW